MIITEKGQIFKQTSPMPANVPFAMHLFGKLGWSYNPEDRWFDHCRTLGDIMDTMLLDTSPIKNLFLTGTSEGPGNLREFYIALMLEAEWTPRPGYDVRTVIEYRHGPELKLIEVRGTRPETKDQYIRVTDSNGVLKADFVIAICMKYSFNPCYADMFVIPRKTLEPLVNTRRRKWEREGKIPKDPRIAITINKNPRDFRKRKENEWWEYHLEDHSKLKDRIEGKEQNKERNQPHLL